MLRLHTRSGDAARAQPYLASILQQQPGHPEVPVFLSALRMAHGGATAATSAHVESDAEDALAKMRVGLLRFTEHYRKQDKYSEAVTRKWMALLGEFVRAERVDLLGTVNAAVERFRK